MQYDVCINGYVNPNCAIQTITGSSDCVLALGFEKMQKGSLGANVSTLHTNFVLSFKVNLSVSLYLEQWGWHLLRIYFPRTFFLLPQIDGPCNIVVVVSLLELNPHSFMCCFLLCPMAWSSIFESQYIVWEYTKGYKMEWLLASLEHILVKCIFITSYS